MKNFKAERTLFNRTHKLGQMPLFQNEINQLEIGDKILIHTEKSEFNLTKRTITDNRIITSIWFDENGDKTIFVNLFGRKEFELQKGEIIKLISRK